MLRLASVNCCISRSWFFRRSSNWPWSVPWFCWATFCASEDEARAAKPERGPRRDRPERGRTGGQQGAERGGDRRANRDRRDAGRSAAPSNSAMADALRRAGLSGK